jgi:aldehyde dehydrogenase (NAD+)
MIPHTPVTDLGTLFEKQRAFFFTHTTKDINFRVQQLKKLKAGIEQYETRICAALKKDLNKSHEEAYLTEISVTLMEIDYHIKHLRKWAKPKRIHTPLHLMPARSRLHAEPLGVALIVSPWNYPFQLVINPLIGAISAGCCAMVKPSPATPAVAEVLDDLLGELFDPSYVVTVHGETEVNQALFHMQFDLIFFTGSPRLGKIVMAAAAENLTPVVLELGGKSPCIVDQDAKIELAAKRIAWGKSINSGQTCIAPDYVLIHEKLKSDFVIAYKKAISEMYGDNPKESDYYPRIVHDDAFERIIGLLEGTSVLYGGDSDKTERYISPTLVDTVDFSHPIMQEEIFGPILPLLTFSDLDEAIRTVNSHEKPLALYYFGYAGSERVIRATSSGGGCINDTLMHIANHHLPFGGVGNSGMGKYHGKESFLAFSNRRPLVTTATWIDLPLKYPPFRYFKWIRKII